MKCLVTATLENLFHWSKLRRVVEVGAQSAMLLNLKKPQFTKNPKQISPTEDVSERYFYSPLLKRLKGLSL